MKRILPALLLLSLSVLGAAELPDGLYARMSTNRGTVVFTLDYRNTPLTTANFCALAEGTLTGSPFYDGLTFYRHAAHYAIFSGDPENTGEGGPGYTLPREKDGALETDAAGVLVMDGFPEESSGSRFFITQSADAFLKSKYTPFGRVVSGKPVVFRLRKGDRIESLRILRVGKEAEELDFSPGRIAALREEAEAKLLAAIAKENPLLAQAIAELGPDRQKTSTGIYYTVLLPGEGERPVAGSRVSMHYIGTLLDGTVFDSSRSRGQTFDFTLGKDGIIPGWIEMVMAMRPGELRKVIIPPKLAYGSQGYGPIQPNSWLIFEMELTAVGEG